MFLLQSDDISLLLCHCNIGCHTKKIKSALYSSLHALLYEILLSIVSCHFFSRFSIANNEGQGQMPSKPRYLCPPSPSILF